jgi:hypothetical protein
VWWCFRYSHEGVHLTNLPFQLCDLTLWTTVVACLTARPVFVEFSYFAGFAGSGMALLTPDLWTPWPTYPAIYFFLVHGGIIVAGAVLAFGKAGALGPAAIWRAFGLLVAYALVVGAFNAALENQLHVSLPQTPEPLFAGLARPLARVSVGWCSSRTRAVLGALASRPPGGYASGVMMRLAKSPPAFQLPQRDKCHRSSFPPKTQPTCIHEFGHWPSKISVSVGGCTLVLPMRQLPGKALLAESILKRCAQKKYFASGISRLRRTIDPFPEVRAGAAGVPNERNGCEDLPPAG